VSAPVLHAVDTGAAGVRAAFSGGDLDVGVVGPNSPEAARRNRLRLAAAAGFDPHRAVVLRQVHGARAVGVGREGGAGDYSGAMGGVAEADASVTRAPGVALLALGADCVPVLLWSSDGVVVGAAHAGWRGLVAGVIPAAVGAMGVDPVGVHAMVGPCVGPCCYPVDVDLRRTMGERFGDDVVRGDAVDLALGARRSLMQAGLTPEAIRGVAACTACGPGTWFSYRRDGERAGRHAGLIWIEEAA
jgi:YfiH family protein